MFFKLASNLKLASIAAEVKPAMKLLSSFTEAEPMLKKHFMSSGDKGLTSDFLLWPFRKLLGKEKVDERLWKHVGRPLAKADFAVGEQLMGKGNTFKRVAKREVGPNIHENVLVPSGLNPLKKVQAFGVPLLASMYLSDKLSKEKQPQPQGDIDEG
jgi:hypothetical protein